MLKSLIDNEAKPDQNTSMKVNEKCMMEVGHQAKGIHRKLVCIIHSLTNHTCYMSSHT